jgi:hypothetical protein
VAVDQPYVMHAWTAPGEYLVSVWAFNDSQPEGVSASITLKVVVSPVHYVAAAEAPARR